MRTSATAIVLACLLTVGALAGCASESAQTPSNGSSPPATGTPSATTHAAKDLTLGVADFPAGWNALGDDPVVLSEPGFKDGHNRGVIKTSGSGQSYVSIQTYAYVFNSTTEAGAYYDKRAAETKAQSSTMDKPHGDRAIYWELTTSDTYELIQKTNVVWRIEKNKGGAIVDDMPMDRAAQALLAKF